MHLHVLFTAGFPPTNTVGDPGAQGAAVTGTQGIGVKTPSAAATHGCGVRTPIAAAVAAATCGFAMDVHIPNGIIFTIGWLSVMHAGGMLLH